MVESHKQGRWNAAGLEGIHCVISATDALLGLKAKLRPAGESHYEAIDVLRQYVKNEATSQQASRLARILEKKNVVEYEGRKFTEPEAAAVVKDVSRYLEWARAFFKSSR